jgi:methionine-gamma-lyase
MEGSAAAQVTASGMSAISCAILQLCGQGDEVVSSRTIYGGTYALFKNFLPRFGITVRFVDTTSLGRPRP